MSGYAPLPDRKLLIDWGFRPCARNGCTVLVNPAIGKLCKEHADRSRAAQRVRRY